MNLRSYILFIALFATIFSFSQNMQEGYTYLETGKYAQAETFFNTVLKDYPKNKTARLCYGRAIGLNGKTAQANLLFTDLLRDYPKDFEVKLNYGESLLWNNNFTKAKSYFKTLIDQNPKSFPALLSYANTLSNLKLYDDALLYINKALKVLPGNPNALNSKKYMYLGYAYQKQQAQQYEEAEALLKQNLTLFKNDKDTLINLANLYLIANKLDEAKATYDLLAKDNTQKTTALNGIALVFHLKGKEKEALKQSTKAFNSINATTNVITKQQTTERYIQALIWNKKYKAAHTLIAELIKDNPNKNWVLALSATLNIYKSDFKESIKDYDQILKNDSTSFDGNLGKANALKAIGFYNEAYQAAENTLTFYNKQKDATNFIKNINTTFTPTYVGKSAYTFDNGDNKAFYINNSLEYPISTKLKILGSYNYRTTSNDITNNKATSNNFSLGITYQLLPNVLFKGTSGLSAAKATTNDYSELLTDISFKIKPFKLQDLTIGYKRELQSFNAELLDRKIVQDNFYANYSVSTNFKLGWFTQFFYTKQNDGNSRNLLFSSLYYNILSNPSLKAGLNYQYITFKNQVPTIYFSPETFNAGEIFINLIKDESNAKANAWFYELTAATGLQRIEDDSSQSTYRVQGKLGYKFSERCLANLFGTRSNIASATAAGFTFNEIGLRFKWLLFDKPVFRN